MRTIVIGEDARINQIHKSIKGSVKYSNEKTLENYELIILPIVYLNPDIELLKTINPNAVVYTGVVTKELKAVIPQIQSILNDSEVKLANDHLTCGGIKAYIENLNLKKILILGFGQIAQLLKDYLAEYKLLYASRDNLEGHIDITNQQALKEACNDNDIVINTIPSNVITEPLNVRVLDIASAPYGADEKTRDQMDYYIYSGIPGKHDPEKAGDILVKKLKKDLGGVL